MAAIPSMMRSLVATHYSPPSEWEVIDMPVPEIVDGDDVLVRVHAASLMTGDTQIAGGAFRRFGPVSFPVKIAAEGAGIVAAVGSAVTGMKVGDEIYGITFSRPVMPLVMRGFASEYVVVKERFLLHMPSHLSFEDAASLLGSTVTAYQSFKLGVDLMGIAAGPGGDYSHALEGKTVLVPGALSGTGSVGCEMAKHAFGATKVISTVSTPKVPLVDEYLPGAVDQVVDYKTEDVMAAIGGPGSIDFLYNTQWDIGSRFAMLKPNSNSALVSIASAPSSQTLKTVLGEDYVPFWAAWGLDLMQMWYWWKLPAGAKMGFISGNPGNREDLEVVGKLIAAGKIRAVTTVVPLSDLDAVRKGAEQVKTGKGGLGKLVFKIR